MVIHYPPARLRHNSDQPTAIQPGAPTPLSTDPAAGPQPPADPSTSRLTASQHLARRPPGSAQVSPGNTAPGRPRSWQPPGLALGSRSRPARHPSTTQKG
jgi:hypothetical protein